MKTTNDFSFVTHFRLCLSIGGALLISDFGSPLVVAQFKTQPSGGEQILQQEPNIIAQPELAKELLERMDRDQAARTKFVEFTKTQSEQRGVGDVTIRQELMNEMATIDRQNREWLSDVVRQHGWLGKSLVGDAASNAAWLLVQHADEDVKLQRDCLDKMQDMPSGEVTPKQIAYLTDRVLLAEGKPQVYGTQCHEVNGKFEPKNVEDPARLDERRESVGLPPMAEYLQMMASMYKPASEQSAEQDAQADQPIEAHSLLGALLRRLPLSEAQSAKLELELNAANEKWDADRNNPENLIWVGRRLAYLSRHRDAIEMFTKGIAQFPNDARFLRHRGHRWITVREFDKAIADFEAAAKLIDGQADEIEPDGQPNPAGIPTSSLHTNVWYHLGLARFLKGDFEGALVAYEKCLAASENNDMRVATLDWQHMTLCRLDRKDDADKLIASITPELKVLENHAYHRRLLLYRGLLKPEELLATKGVSDESAKKDDTDRDVELATNGFGVAHWYLIQGNELRAREIFEQVVAGKNWGAFGFIAAEAELVRLNEKKVER